jgi:hypothetical protein
LPANPPPPPRPLLDKLGVKPGQRVAIVGMEDAAFEALLATRVIVTEARVNLDLIFYGADSEAELAAIAALIPALAPRGAIWIVSLKGKLAKIGHPQTIAAGKAAGLVDNKVVAFSETRTALRFTRPLAKR